ncbi:hypothetical protein A2U01_0096084, partial [Trifolium medium]|nr:hypothetical protein [Trifolium medium]
MLNSRQSNSSISCTSISSGVYVTSSSVPSADSSYHGPLCSRVSSSTLSSIHSEF